MKKVKVVVFIATLVLGIALASVFSIGKVFANSCNLFSFGKIEGSGVAKTENRNKSDFSNVDISGALTVEIVAQKDFSVEVEADDNLISYIKTEVKGDTLKVYSEKRLSPKTSIKIKVSMPEISELDISGASNATLTNVKNENLRVDLSGASKVKIDGETQNLDVDASGASKIDAENLKSENALVNASGACKIDVFVTNELKADASGASKIIYTGEPKNIIKDTSGASSVKSK
ncbi:MAG: DUF2807 domain-containing protein [Pyrinomonadaceae bacterium]|nr:DUF2807 domain-containing protein [Pyrinomonadaceae bacterium]